MSDQLNMDVQECFVAFVQPILAQAIASYNSNYLLFATATKRCVALKSNDQRLV